MKDQFFRHCLLVRPFPPPTRGDEIHVAWIPEEHVEINRVISLKRNGQWEDGWKIVCVSKVRLDGNYILEYERDYKIQRSASDI